MHKFFVTLILLLPFAGPAYTLSQEVNSKSYEQHSRPDFKKLETLLRLDKSTSEQFRALTKKHHETLRANRRDHQKKKQKMKAIHDAHKQELSSLLSDEQMKIFDGYMNQFKHGKRHKRNRQSNY